MRKFLRFTLMALLCAVFNAAWGQETTTIAMGTFKGSSKGGNTEGWTTTGTDKSGYVLIDYGQSIKSPSIDFTQYESITVKVKGARFGEIKYDNKSQANVNASVGDKVVCSYEYTTTSGVDVSKTFTPTSDMTEGSIEFTCPNAQDNKDKKGANIEDGARIYEITITGVKSSTEPAIKVGETSITAEAAEKSGEVSVTYKNFEAEDAEVVLCDAEGNTTTYDWFEASFKTGGINTIEYLIDENTSKEERKAYFKVYCLDADANDIYSDIITVTQAGKVEDYATLPFTFSGGVNGITTTDGLTQNGLGSDYNDSKALLKFDSTGDNVILKFNERPGTLTFNIKGNGFSGGTFTVQVSEDGSTYADKASYTTISSSNGGDEIVIDDLGENVRYIKWIYTEKKSGNVGLGSIVLEKYKGDAQIEWSAAEYTATMYEDNEFPTLTNPNKLSVTYSSSDATVATISSEGVVFLQGVGTATIKATFDGNDDYNKAVATYTLTVKESEKPMIDFESSPINIYAFADGETGTINVIYKNFTVDTESLHVKFFDNAVYNGDEDDIEEIKTYGDDECEWITITFDENGNVNYTVEKTDLAYERSISFITFASGTDADGNAVEDVYSDPVFVFQDGMPISMEAESYEINAPAAGVTDGKLKLTLENIQEDNLTIDWCYEDEEPEWIHFVLDVNDCIVLDENGNLQYTIDPNATGEERIVYFDITGYGKDEGNKEMSLDNPICVTQAATDDTPSDGNTIYRKVTATDDITDGEYLIVYETGSVAFNGALETLDATNNTISVTIENNEIKGNETVDAAVFTIDKTAGTIKSASGKYIGVTSYGNGLKAQDTGIQHTSMTIDNNGNALLAVYAKSSKEEGNMTLKYNKASDQNRFRYYKSDQQDIQLYKKVAEETIDITFNQLAEGYATLYYGTKNLAIPEGVRAFTYNVGENGGVETEYTDVIPAGSAVVVELKDKTNWSDGKHIEKFPVTTATATAHDDNMLYGFDEEGQQTTGPDDSKDYYFYTLSLNGSNEAGSIGFYWFNDGGVAFTSAAHRAYLAVPKDGTKAQAFAFDGSSTGISTVAAEDKAEGVYTLSGVRMSGDRLPKGIYIVNGKKTVIK